MSHNPEGEVLTKRQAEELLAFENARRPELSRIEQRFRQWMREEVREQLDDPYSALNRHGAIQISDAVAASLTKHLEEIREDPELSDACLRKAVANPGECLEFLRVQQGRRYSD